MWGAGFGFLVGLFFGEGRCDLMGLDAMLRGTFLWKKESERGFEGGFFFNIERERERGGGGGGVLNFRRLGDWC